MMTDSVRPDPDAPGPIWMRTRDWVRMFLAFLSVGVGLGILILLLFG